MSSEPESFLVRWSRRKREAEREADRPAGPAAPELPAAPPATAGGAGVAAEAPVAPPSAGRDPDAATAVPLPPIESLDGLRSDYQAFFEQPVAEELRRAALKKLFADPHFNQMDMLDVYVDDYTQFEPLPEAMRMRLPSARAFLLDSERAALEAAEAPSGATGNAPEPGAATAVEEIGAPASPDDAGEARSFANEAASVEPTSTLTGAPNAAPADAPSADDPNGPARESSAPAGPRGIPAAPDPPST